MKIGYARVSTQHQNLDRQLAALEAEGCDQVFAEKASGKNTKQRPELQSALAALTSGDVFVVAEWDRATRSYDDGFAIIADIQSRKALLKVLDRPYLDLTTPLGKALLGLLSAWAEDERKRRLEQASDGRRHARERGVKLGRKPKLSPHQQNQARRMLGDGDSVREVARMFNVSQATIQRLKSAA
jgi:DNA invertase Pin-like site-specific DNA recombinase